MSEDLEQQTRVSPVLENSSPVLLPAFEVGERPLGFVPQPLGSAGYVDHGSLVPELLPAKSPSLGVLRILIIVFVVISALVAFLVYDELRQGHDPMDSLGRLIGLAEPSENISIEQEIARSQALAKSRQQRKAVPVAEVAAPENPYWRLPNALARSPV